MPFVRDGLHSIARHLTVSFTNRYKMIPDISRIRKDFPILDQKVNGKSLIYFDNAATSQRPVQVIDRMDEFSLRFNANIHRATHFLANKTTEAFESARETVRQYINAAESA